MSDALVRASIDGALVAAAIWLAARYLRGLSPSARAALWWCATSKFVIALFWITPVAVPVLPARDDVRLKAEASAQPDQRAQVETTAPGKTTQAASTGMTPSGVGRTITPASALLGAWTAGVVVAMCVGLHRWVRTAGLVSRASAVPLELHAMAEHLATRLRLRRAPDVRVSPEIDTPLVVGVLRPAVLVPPTFRTLPAPQQQMALCHELAHVARGDLWLGCVPALAERLFFFHPLVRLAAREYAFWRESACDARVLDLLDAAPEEYGRLLLGLGVAQPRTSLAAAGAPWSFKNSNGGLPCFEIHQRAR